MEGYIGHLDKERFKLLSIVNSMETEDIKKLLENKKVDKKFRNFV